MESLESRPLQVASEYFTVDEMVSFKKVKRRVKKVRSKVDRVLKADDLLQDTTEEIASADLGSRSRKRNVDEEQDVEGTHLLIILLWSWFDVNFLLDVFSITDLSGFKVELDDSQKEVNQARLKASKIKQKKVSQWDINMIARSVKQEPVEENDCMDEDPSKSSIVLNATAEFCRTLGDIPTYGMAGNRDEDEDELMVKSAHVQYLNMRNVMWILLGLRTSISRRATKESRKRRTKKRSRATSRKGWMECARERARSRIR